MTMEGRRYERHPIPLRTTAEPTTIVVVESTEGRIIKFSYVWKIENFNAKSKSLRNDKPLRSPVFTPRAGGSRWRLIVYPNGKADTDHQYVSIFLWLCDSNAAVVRASCQFHVINAMQKKICVFRGEKCFTFIRQASTSFTGRPRCLARKNLTKNRGGFLHDGNLTIVCDVEISKPDCACRDVVSRRPFEISERPLAGDFGLFENPELSDLTIVVDGREIPAHKNILAARSPVFASKLAIEWETPSRMEVPGACYEVFKELLRYVYRGEVMNMAGLAGRLLATADEYKLEKLKALCEESLGAIIGVENAGELLVTADLCNADRLKRRVIDFISRHALEVTGNAEFEKAVCAKPLLILEAFSHLAERLRGQPMD